jgi:hypothetical protein
MSTYFIRAMWCTVAAWLIMKTFAKHGIHAAIVVMVTVGVIEMKEDDADRP